MSSIVKLVQSDDLPSVSFSIKDANRAAEGMVLDRKDPETWRPVDLTGAVVSAAVSDAGSNKQIDVVEVYVISPLTGEVMLYLNNCTFIGKAGLYDCEVTVDFPIGQQTVYDMLTFDVRERINAPASV